MNKKDKLRKLIDQKNNEKGFFNEPPNRVHLIMAMVISPIIILSVVIDWIFNLGWVSKGELPKNVFRIILIVIGIFIPFMTWIQYDTKVREEKKENKKIEKLIDELKE